MREIEERIRDIECNRSSSQGGGSRSTASGSNGGGGVAAPSSALGGGVIVGVDDGADNDLICERSTEESDDNSYYSDLEEEEEEDDEDTIGALLSSVSLSNNHKYQSDDDEEEDEDTIGPFLSSTSLAVQPLEEDDDEEDEVEAGIEIQGHRVSVSSLNFCESTSSFVSINSKSGNDSSAPLTESNSGDDGGEPSSFVSINSKRGNDSSAPLTDGSSEDDEGEPSKNATPSRRKVRFDDDEQYQPSRQSFPPSQAPVINIDDSISRRSQGIKERWGDNEKMVKNHWQSGACGSVGSTGSGDSHRFNGKSGDSEASTTSSASNSSGDYHTLKTLLSSPERHRGKVCNHSTISEEDEYCGDIVPGSRTKKSLAAMPLTQKNTTTVPAKGGGVQSRHGEHFRNPLERKGTQSSTSSASSISTLLEHAPLDVHLTGLQKRRSKLLEMVGAQEQNSDDTKTQRSIEFSLFLMKDKLNQLQDLGVLGEEDEEEILKSGGTRRLLRKIKSEGTNRSEGREVLPYKRSSNTSTPESHYH